MPKGAFALIFAVFAATSAAAVCSSGQVVSRQTTCTCDQTRWNTLACSGFSGQCRDLFPGTQC